MTTSVPEIDLSDRQVGRDPATAYGRAREHSPPARLRTPGMGPMWAVLRYQEAKAMLADPRFELNPISYLAPQVPADCRDYMHTMQEMEGPEHARLRRLAAPAFTARRAGDTGRVPDPGTWRLSYRRVGQGPLRSPHGGPADHGAFPAPTTPRVFARA